MNTICLAIDRLQAGYLGAYGNAWIETPNLDRLAAESFVFDQYYLDSPATDHLCRSYWQGWHPWLSEGPPADRPALPDLLARAGVTTLLMTDDAQIAARPLAERFARLVQIEPSWGTAVADEVDQTHLAHVFARLVDEVATAEGPFFLWAHLLGLGGPWDAPLDFRLRYWDVGDPDPPHTAEVPHRLLDKDFDPDLVLGYAQAYAGQVSLLDVCLGGLLEFLESSPLGRDTLLVLLSPRGFPLGEHRRVGDCQEVLHEELVHLPLMLRFPDLRTTSEVADLACGPGVALSGADPRYAAARSQALVQPADVWATLLDCCSVADRPPAPWAGSLLPIVRDDAEAIRDRICLVDASSGMAIRTPAWYLREGETPELFLKPDDRWEVNDVAVRCGEVVELLRNAAAAYREHLLSGRLAELPPLEEVLRVGLD